MTLLYGQRGQAAGTITEDALYLANGARFGVVEGDHIFSVLDGSYIGCYTSGIVFDASGEPQAFAADCSPAVPLIAPKLKSILLPKLSGQGHNVQTQPDRTPPNFLKAKLAAAKTEWFK